LGGPPFLTTSREKEGRRTGKTIPRDVRKKIGGEERRRRRALVKRPTRERRKKREAEELTKRGAVTVRTSFLRKLKTKPRRGPSATLLSIVKGKEGEGGPK